MEGYTFYVESKDSVTDEFLGRFLSEIKEKEKFVWKLLGPGFFSVRFEGRFGFSIESRAKLKEIAYIHEDHEVAPCKD